MRRRPSPPEAILRALPLLLAAAVVGAGGPAAAAPGANAGAVTVTPAAAIEGDQGLRVTVDGRLGVRQQAFLVDGTPDDERTYRAVFWLDASRLKMAGGDSFVLFEGLVRGAGGAGPRLVPAFRLVVRKGSRFAAPRLLGEAVGTDGSRRETRTIPLPARRGPHRIQVEWQAAAGDPPGGGLLRLSLLGDRPAAVVAPPVASAGQRLVNVRLGAVRGVDAGTHGSFDLDGFASFRELAD